MTFSRAMVISGGSCRRKSRQKSTDCSTYHSGKYTWGTKPPWITSRRTPSSRARSTAWRYRFSVTCRTSGSMAQGASSAKGAWNQKRSTPAMSRRTASATVRSSRLGA